MTYAIWSHEHRQWWRAERQGYTSQAKDAGQYSASEAAEIVLDHVPAGEEVAMPWEVAQRHGTRYIWRAEPILVVDPYDARSGGAL